MRSELIGVVLGAALIGGLYYAAGHPARHVSRVAPPAAHSQIDVAAINAAVRSVQPGFVGVKRIGDWTLACAAKPLLIGRDPQPSPASPKAARTTPSPVADKLAPKPESGAVASEKPAGSGISLGRCRSLLEFRRSAAPKTVALVLAFRIVGQRPGKLALFIRMAAGAKGQKVELRTAKETLDVPVTGCGKGGCTAAGILAQGAEAGFAGVVQGELVLPSGAGSPRKAIRVPLVGLAASLAALRRAQS